MIATILLSSLFTILPQNENKIVTTIANEYKLTEEQTALMCAIRRSENGRQALAFGVMNPKCRTYRKQARWTANTIRLRYDGNVEKFAKRWCPTNWKVWLKNVKWFMKKQGVNKYAK